MSCKRTCWTTLAGLVCATVLVACEMEPSVVVGQAPHKEMNGAGKAGSAGTSGATAGRDDDDHGEADDHRE
jgi:hypothetical protein